MFSKNAKKTAIAAAIAASVCFTAPLAASTRVQALDSLDAQPSFAHSFLDSLEALLERLDRLIGTEDQRQPREQTVTKCEANMDPVGCSNNGG